jgi:hypothetical protein
MVSITTLYCLTQNATLKRSLCVHNLKRVCLKRIFTVKSEMNTVVMRQ